MPVPRARLTAPTAGRRDATPHEHETEEEPTVANELQGRTVAILATDGVEKVELVQPRDELRKAGARVEVVSLSTDPIQSMSADINPDEARRRPRRRGRVRRRLRRPGAARRHRERTTSGPTPPRWRS